MMHGVFRYTEILRDFFNDCRPRVTSSHSGTLALGALALLGSTGARHA